MFLVCRESTNGSRQTREHSFQEGDVHMAAMNVSRTNQPGPSPTSQGLPSGEKTGQTAQAVKRAAPEASRIAQRAYELYLQRDRQDGRAMEDWLKAEQQLQEAVSHK
jgi:hypothetical protein